MTEVDQLPKVDTLIGLQKVLYSYINVTFPLCVGGILVVTRIPVPSLPLFLELIFLFSNAAITLNFIFVTIMMFVGENEGPSLWQNMAPKFFKYGTILFYLILPSFFLIWIGGVISLTGFDKASNPYLTWLMLFMYIQLG
jgi:hypothetical protein